MNEGSSTALTTGSSSHTTTREGTAWIGLSFDHQREATARDQAKGSGKQR